MRIKLTEFSMYFTHWANLTGEEVDFTESSLETCGREKARDIFTYWSVIQQYRNLS